MQNPIKKFPYVDSVNVIIVVMYYYIQVLMSRMKVLQLQIMIYGLSHN